MASPSSTSVISGMVRFCSIWDLYKELQNMARYQDPMWIRSPEKNFQWLRQRLGWLPKDYEILARAYRLTSLQHREVWKEMANCHLEVLLLLRRAAVGPEKFPRLFDQAIEEMAKFLEKFATKAAPLSPSPRDPSDKQFNILMENFGTVIDTIGIFYDYFGCEQRSEILRDERDAGRMDFFTFEKNDPPNPLALEVSRELLNKAYPSYQQAEPELPIDFVVDDGVDYNVLFFSLLDYGFD